MRMIGSLPQFQFSCSQIRSPTSGNTLDAFIALAAKASDSTIPPNAPLGGVLTVNGTVLTSLGGAVLGSGTSSSSPPVSTAISNVPPPGSSIPADVANMAGGAPPSSYNWAPSISDNAINLLQLINFLDNALLEVLVNGHNNLTTGGWSNLYPNSITNMIGSMTAQAMVHRSTATDSLKHYSKQVIGLCDYSFPISNVDDFVLISLTLILLEIGLLLEVIGAAAATDPWMVGPLSSTMGSKARMSGMVNMMQNHIPAATPREVMMPATLVYSYVMNHYVVPGSCPDKLGYNTLSSFSMTKGQTNSNNKVTSVIVNYDFSQNKNLYVAWLGPWGNVEYTPVVVDSSNKQGTANVPDGLSGHVWGVLTSGNSGTVADVTGMAVAGPEMLWVSQP